MKRSPLRKKRPTPRRNEGRVQHERMRPKASAPPTPEQIEYSEWLRDSIGRCEACGVRHNLVIHHLLSKVAGKKGRRDHWFLVLLCPHCHNMGSQSVHLLGSEGKFKKVHGVDLPAVSVARLAQWVKEKAA